MEKRLSSQAIEAALPEENAGIEMKLSTYTLLKQQYLGEERERER